MKNMCPVLTGVVLYFGFAVYMKNIVKLLVISKKKALN